MRFKGVRWNWGSVMIGFHAGANPVSGQKFLFIGLGPFLGLDFERKPYGLNDLERTMRSL